MNTKILALVAFIALTPRAHAADTLRVITTTTDLADIVRQVGGDHVKVESIAKGFQNPHFVDAKPSHIVKLIKADAFILTGLDLEVGWVPILVQGSRNKKVMPGSVGYIDASEAIEAIEVPVNPTRAMGDVHPGGNPHYMMDPENVLLVADLLAKRLGEIEPSLSEAFNSNNNEFKENLKAKIQTWKSEMAPLKGTNLVTYHKSWSYFFKYFGLVNVGQIEPKPGIPPTPRHTAQLIDNAKEKKIQFVLVTPWYEKKTAKFIAEQTGATLLTLSLFPNPKADTKTYFDMMDKNIKALRGAKLSSQ